MKSINEMSLTECLDALRHSDTPLADAYDIADRIHELTRWIPVEERLPDDDFDYVHVYYDGMIATMCYSKQKGFHGATANRMEMFAREITHWRRIDRPEGV